MDDRAGGAVTRVQHYLNAAFQLKLRGDGVEIGGNDVEGTMRAFLV